MEHAQRAHTTRTNSVDSVGGLNPYFNGTCSKRRAVRALDAACQLS